MASENPVRPSTAAMSMSWTPRLRSSINYPAASLYDYCMRIEAEYPKSDGIWEPVAGWPAAERQRLKREDLGSMRNQNRPPNKKVRGAAVAAPPRIGARRTPRRVQDSHPSFYIREGSNGTEKEQVCRYRSGKKEHGSVHSLRWEARNPVKLQNGHTWSNTTLRKPSCN